MTVEREIAGITLPFITGIAVQAYVQTLFLHSSQWTATFSLSITLLMTICLLHPMHRTWNRRSARSIISVIFFTCGIFLSSTSCFIHPDIPGRLISFASEAGQSMSDTINMIGFRNNNTNAIINALLTGDRTGLSKEVTEAFRDSGASHILAISGLHLGIIHSIVKKILLILGNSPCSVKIRSLTTIAICGFYSLAVGAGASVIRAFIFISMYETSAMTGRYKSLRHVLMAAITVHLAISPESIEEIGFQLSYAAMAGIAFINPRLSEFWPKDDKSIAGRMWRAAALSISCQITTGPLAYIYFGTLPKYFLLTNLIALPLTGIIIPLSLTTLVLSCSDICPEILLRATEALIQALSEALSIISSM